MQVIPLSGHCLHGLYHKQHTLSVSVSVMCSMRVRVRLPTHYSQIVDSSPALSFKQQLMEAASSDRLDIVDTIMARYPQVLDQLSRGEFVRFLRLVLSMRLKRESFEE